jgi:hypothetical protein
MLDTVNRQSSILILMRYRGIFSVSFDRSEVATLYLVEYVRLLLTFLFRVEFFDFRVSAWLVYSVGGAGLLTHRYLMTRLSLQVVYL